MHLARNARLRDDDLERNARIREDYLKAARHLRDLHRTLSRTDLRRQSRQWAVASARHWLSRLDDAAERAAFVLAN